MRWSGKTDDALRDFVRFEEEEAERLSRLPECSLCGEPIDQESAVYMNGEWFCDECLDDCRKVIDG